MEISTIIGYVLLGIFGLFTLISALIGLGRGLKKTLGSTVVMVISAIAAYLVTVLVFKPSPDDAGVIAQKLTELLSGSGLDSLLEMPGLSTAMSYYVYMLVAPFIFVLLFTAIRFILGIIVRILMHHIPILNNISKPAKRLGGLGVGLVNGAVLCLILFMPLLGTLDVANTAIKNLEAVEEEPEAQISVIEQLSAESGEEDITDYLDAAVNQGAGKAMLDFGGRLMYDGITTTKYYDKKVNLRNEVNVLTTVVGDISSMGSDAGSMVVAIDAVVYGVENSPIVEDFAASLMSEMATSWLNGEEFMGTQKVSMGGWFDPMIDTVLEIIATEDREHVHDDLKSIADFMHKADELGFMGSTDTGSDTFKSLGEKGTLASILGTIENNDRMLPLIDELNVVCIKIFSEDLGFCEDHEEVYNDLIKEISGYANQMATGMTSKYDVYDLLAFELADHGIRMTDEETKALVDALDAEYDRLYSDMPDRIKAFFMLYDAVANNTLVEGADGRLTSGGEQIEYYFVNGYKNSAAYILASSGISIGDASSLSSYKTMKTVLITTDEILASVVKYADISDRHAESESIDAVMVSMIDAFNNLGGNSLHASYVMGEMGHVLDMMHRTNVFGQTTETFLTAIMQSHKVADSIGLNVVEMTDFANKIHSGMGENTGYEQISIVVSHSFDVLENINDGEMKKETIKELMKDLTPETAKVMQDIATPSLMQNYGVKADNAEKSANAISTLFGNMSTYTANHPQGDMSDEEYKESIAHEAEAVDKIITLAIKANEDIDNKTALFNTDGGNGSLEMSAYDMVDLFATSTVADDTATQLVSGENGEDPLGAKNGFLASDRAELEGALEQYGEDNKDVDGIDDKLTTIGALFGVEYGA